MTCEVLPSLMSLCLLRNQSGIFVLPGVLHDGDNLLYIFLRQLTGSLVQRNVCLLQHNVGIPSTNTLNSSHGKHDISFSFNVCVHNTKDMLEVRRNNQRHLLSCRSESSNIS